MACRREKHHFSLSAITRYVFLEQGVYWVPQESVPSLREVSDRDKDGLILYDINTEQDHAVNTNFLKSWKSIIASSPSEHHFRSWEKHNLRTTRRYVMKSWDWSEVYLACDESIIQHTLDEWRRAFTNYGSSARCLSKQADDQIEKNFNREVAIIGEKPSQLLLSERAVVFDTISQYLIQVSPRVCNGIMKPEAMEGTTAFVFIADKLILKRKKDIAIALRREKKT